MVGDYDILGGNIHNLCWLEQTFKENYIKCCQVYDVSASSLGPLQRNGPERRHRTNTAVEGDSDEFDTFREFFQCFLIWKSLELLRMV